MTSVFAGGGNDSFQDQDMMNELEGQVFMNEKMLISHTARTYTHMATDIAHKLQGG